MKNKFNFENLKIKINLKNIVLSIFLFMILCYIVFDKPEFSVGFFDFIIYKFSNFFLFMPFLFIIMIIMDFKILKNSFYNKYNKVFSVFLVFVFSIFFYKTSFLLYSDEYVDKYNNFSNASIEYNEVNKGIENADDVVDDIYLEKSDNTKSEDVDTEIVVENEKSQVVVEDKDKNEDRNVVIADTEQDSVNDIENNDKDIVSNEVLLKVHFIDVGQGDAIFIELPNSETMLIDAGTATKGKVVSNYISVLKYTDIDYLVGTHPHADHIGGLATIIDDFEIGNIYMPKYVSTSKTYENLLETIFENDLKVKTAKSGISILNDDNLSIRIISPTKEYSDANNSSVVIKITYKNRSFLFMGDAEEKVEVDITGDLSADVVKVGHHGSDTSSSYDFIQKVNASYAIISVGEGNQYNHPYDFIVERWESSGAKVFRTDLDGTIVIETNGESLIVS